MDFESMSADELNAEINRLQEEVVAKVTEATAAGDTAKAGEYAQELQVKLAPMMAALTSKLG